MCVVDNNRCNVQIENFGGGLSTLVITGLRNNNATRKRSNHSHTSHMNDNRQFVRFANELWVCTRVYIRTASSNIIATSNALTSCLSPFRSLTTNFHSRHRMASMCFASTRTTKFSFARTCLSSLRSDKRLRRRMLNRYRSWHRSRNTVRPWGT